MAPRTSSPIGDSAGRAPTPEQTMNGYPGSKGASGLAERIIRQMPPHKVYIEAFAGFAAIFRKKLAADQTILIDRDNKTFHRLRSYIAGRADAGRVEVLHGDALDLLPSLPAVRSPDTMLFVDPPYLLETRSKKELYDFEFEAKLHEEMLIVLQTQVSCMVMISGYRSALYDRILKRWRRVDIPAMTHGGLRTESVWCSFPEPAILHDPRFAGGDYRERELVKRQQKRWAARFKAMDARRRQVIAAALIDVDRASVEAALRSTQA
jgi:DNA adenine methylase